MFSCGGEAQQPTTGRFRQSRRRICRAEIRRTEGVEASALGRETRNTQDNNYYQLRTTQRAFMQRVQRCTVLRVRAGAGEWRGPWQSRQHCGCVDTSIPSCFSLPVRSPRLRTTIAAAASATSSRAAATAVTAKISHRMWTLPFAAATSGGHGALLRSHRGDDGRGPRCSRDVAEM